MFLQRAFKSSVVVKTGVLLLVVLPASSVSQIESTQAEESSEPIEEIVVHGHKSIIDLKHEMYEAEETLYDVYNSLNSDDDYDIHCYEEVPTGTKIPKRVCRTNFYEKQLRRETQRMLPINLVFEIRKMNERMLAEMQELASTHPEYLKAIESYDQTKRTWESVRKRRCEGRLFICRRQ